MLIDTNLCGNLSYDKHIDNENICLPNLEEELVIICAGKPMGLPVG